MHSPHSSGGGTTWKELKAFVQQQQHQTPIGTAVAAQMQKLWVLCQQLLGSEESGALIDDAALFVLRMLLDVERMLLSHLAEMRKIFGPIAAALGNSMFATVKELGSSMSDEMRALVQQTSATRDRPDDDDGAKAAVPLWAGCDDDGWVLECLLPTDVPHDASMLQEFPLYQGATGGIVKEFSMQYDPAESAAATTIASTGSSTGSGSSDKFNRTWLAAHLNPDLIQPLLEMLRSTRSNDELQNDLFELFGFDKFEILQQILDNRRIVQQRVEAEDKLVRLLTKTASAAAASSHNNHDNAVPQRPSIMSQVIVQSEQEKHLLKQVRKDEKKLRTLMQADANATAAAADDDSEESIVAKIRLAQQQQLLHASQRQPLFKDRAFHTAQNIQQARIRYPFVFDAEREAKSHVGYVSGAKLMLPDNVQRQDSKMYEEVRIPAVDASATLTVGARRIDIGSLDEIGRVAFAGTKQLNRIQSVVYATAYHSNENMLVCAPTGAGKTNVAMLTIVHTLRAHCDQGHINRDDFKIVYIAPMKALAAEMVENFGRRLRPLGIAVRELTGDMSLTKAEMQQTQMLVTTPEKWDVVTRKGAGDVALITLVKLLIIDEVHLLHGDRGPVVEAVVARTLRLVESQQSMIRIVGLSATLPNYIDVARFLRVNPMVGLFFFDGRFRPVPLAQTFIGVKGNQPLKVMNDQTIVCYEKCAEMLRDGHQIMVFVHARNATVRTAQALREFAQQKNQMSLFTVAGTSESYALAKRAMAKSRNRQLSELFESGLAMHHAGMLRSDRQLVEKYFGEGHIKVLVCTATLAWGVNLPAHAVIIKGTEIYNSKQGSFVDLGILDVLQIFGRAGRPQFDKSGSGTIITSHDKLNHYLSLLTNQFPIESNFIDCLADNLNAEVTLGTICNVDEAIEWLSYTYLFVRMRINPQVYGINYADVQEDPSLERKRRELIVASAMRLDKAQMIRFNKRTGDLNVTDLGRTASHYYIKYDTVEVFNEMLKPVMTESEVLAMMSHAQEFEQLKVRDEELLELDDLVQDYCEVTALGGAENLHGKVNILMQTFLSRGQVRAFSLISDMSYITQNAVRIARALFSIELRKNNAILAGRLLMMSKMFERQMWDFQTPLRQFTCIPFDIIEKIENRGLSIYALREMSAREIGDFVRNQRYGAMLARCAAEFPLLDIEALLQPITRTVLRIRIFVTPDFQWNDRVHGRTAESFWIWIEDPESNFIYHSENLLMTKKLALSGQPHELVLTIPLKDPLPPQYHIRVISDTWLGSQSSFPLSFKHLILPELHPPHTELLPLQPLPLAALREPRFEALYSFTHFNPIQTQIFHCLYHTDNNVLLGAPTGSGKTIAAELAMFRVFREYPGRKVVYIAPLKALVRERMEDWRVRLEQRLGKRVVELTGDVTPDAAAIRASHVIVTTPEKWDGISRSWQTREYVKDVALIVIDEIHLLGEDRGPVLEVIVSRTNFIASHTKRTLRIVGLSTALANARDLANWLGIEQMGLYNFKPSVRPVPISVHINGFPGKHYCPRMATMNRPCYQAIRQYSPCTPALIFVSSRRQTRLTALDLISFLAAEDNPRQFMHMPESELTQILENIKDANLKLTLAFGIGLHHAGLQERDRRTCEELFLHRKIQVLVATSTLAWGVNLPAHLVIVKGTEFYDGKLKRYVDMPITDVLQMMGRAGRPQFGNEGIAVVLVHDVKKNFYKKFLYDPFPVESSLLNVLPDHINAEIVAGTVQSKQAILDYLTWTYCFRRLLKNPTYYDLATVQPEDVNRFVSSLIQNVLDVLEQAGCVEIAEEDERCIRPTSMGRIASYYYLSYQSMRHFADALGWDMSWEAMLKAMCDAYEFDQQPVRHNEDMHNEELAKECRIKVAGSTYDSPHTKVLLLMQAHFSHLVLPNSDYLTDTKSVLDQSMRIMQVRGERGGQTHPSPPNVEY